MISILALVRDAPKHVVECIHSLLSTIEQLRALARDIEHAERTPLDVHRLGVDLQKRWIDPLAASHRRLDITIADDLPRVRASPAAVLSGRPLIRPLRSLTQRSSSVIERSLV